MTNPVFQNQWRVVTNGLRVLVIKAHFSLDLKIYVKQLKNLSQKSKMCSKKCDKNSFQQIEGGGRYVLIR